MVDCRLNRNRNKLVCKRDYPLQSTDRQLRNAASRADAYLSNNLSNNLSNRDIKIIKDVERRMAKQEDTLHRFTAKSGMLYKRREAIHKKIISNQFKGVPVDPNDPDLYIFAGLPASGKSSVLRKKVPERAVTIDSDEYKSILARRTKSPSNKFKLIHAALLHEESDLLFKRAIDTAIKKKENVILDMTFGNYGKGRNLIKRFREEGYDIHLLSTQKYPHITIGHAASRFIKNGRYVPPAYIAQKGNHISQNSWKAKILADTYQIYDTNTRKPLLVVKSRRGIKSDIRNP